MLWVEREERGGGGKRKRFILLGIEWEGNFSLNPSTSILFTLFFVDNRLEKYTHYTAGIWWRISLSPVYKPAAGAYEDDDEDDNDDDDDNGDKRKWIYGVRAPWQEDIQTLSCPPNPKRCSTPSYGYLCIEKIIPIHYTLLSIRSSHHHRRSLCGCHYYLYYI